MTDHQLQDSKHTWESYDSTHSWFVGTDELTSDPLVSGLFTAEDFDTLFEAAERCLKERVYAIGIVYESKDGQVAIDVFPVLDIVAARLLWVITGQSGPLTHQ